MKSWSWRKGEKKEMVKEEWAAKANLSAVGNIINAMIDGVALYNLEGGVTQINKAASEMFGYEAREAIGKPITDFVSQRMAPGFEEMIKETLAKGFTRRNAEFVGLTKEGKEFPVSISTTLLKDAQTHVQDEPKEIIMVIRDTTEINKRIADLEVSKARYDSIMSSVADITVSFDNKGIIRTLNPFGKNFVEEVLGYKLDDIVGKSYTELTYLISAEEIERVGELVREVVETGAVLGLELNQMYKHNGKTIPVAFSLSSIKDIEGKNIGVVCVGRYMREIRVQIDDLKRAKAELELRVKDFEKL